MRPYVEELVSKFPCCSGSPLLGKCSGQEESSVASVSLDMDARHG